MVLRACATAALTRTGSGLRPTGFLSAGRLAAFLPFADLGAGLLAGIKGSSKRHQPREERAIIPTDPGLYRRCSTACARTAYTARQSGRRSARTAQRRPYGVHAASKRARYGSVTGGWARQPLCRRSATTVV